MVSLDKFAERIIEVGERGERSLLNILNNTSLATGFLIGGRIADEISTHAGLSRYGVSIEQNPVARHFMENLGRIGGALTYEAALLPVLGLLTWGLNKLGDKENFPFKIGNTVVLYCFGTVSYLIANSNVNSVINYSNYF